MSTLSVLKPEEYPSLCNVHDGFTPDPRISIAIVAREDGEIIGRVFLLAPIHVEGTWVDKSKGNSGLAARLMDKAEEEAQHIGISKMFAYAVSDEIAGYLQRLGYVREPWTVWSKEL